jgi:hypothetical protein
VEMVSSNGAWANAWLDPPVPKKKVARNRLTPRTPKNDLPFLPLISILL